LEKGEVAPPVEPDPAPNGKADVAAAQLNEGNQRRIAAGLAPIPASAPAPAPAPAPVAAAPVAPVAPVAAEAPTAPVLTSPLD